MSSTTTFDTLKTSVTKRYWNDPSGQGTADVEEAVKDALRSLSEIDDWSFLRSVHRVTTTPDYTTGTASISVDGTRLTGSGTSWLTQALDDDWGMKLNGESIDYLVSGSVSEASLTLTSAYVGAAALSGVSYIAFKRFYALPTNFRKALYIVDARKPYSAMRRATQAEMISLGAGSASVGEPTDYSIENKIGGMEKQLWLYPYPDGRYQYDIGYQRYATMPSSGSDTLDWPDGLFPLLRDAVIVELADKRGDMEVYQKAQHSYALKLQAAIAGDVQDRSSQFIGGGIKGYDKPWGLHKTVN